MLQCRTRKTRIRTCGVGWDLRRLAHGDKTSTRQDAAGAEKRPRAFCCGARTSTQPSEREGPPAGCCCARRSHVRRRCRPRSPSPCSRSSRRPSVCRRPSSCALRPLRRSAGTCLVKIRSVRARAALVRGGEPFFSGYFFFCGPGAPSSALRSAGRRAPPTSGRVWGPLTGSARARSASHGRVSHLALVDSQTRRVIFKKAQSYVAEYRKAEAQAVAARYVRWFWARAPGSSWLTCRSLFLSPQPPGPQGWQLLP